MDEKKKANIIRIAKNVGFGVLVLLAIIAIARNAKKQPEPVQEQAPVEIAMKATQPIDVAGAVYDFTGVRFEFDTTDASVPQGHTWVKMWFADFTRNGSAITFGKPYKLGFHAGTCVDAVAIDTTGETGIPFGFAQCTQEGKVRDIAVFQENQSVVVKFRDVQEGVPTAFTTLHTIDVASIVQSPNGAVQTSPVAPAPSVDAPSASIVAEVVSQDATTQEQAPSSTIPVTPEEPKA